VPDVKVAAELSRNISGCAVIADRGYDSNGFRRELVGNNNEPVIPGRGYSLSSGNAVDAGGGGSYWRR
jgi:hypothetical protein